MLFWIRFIGGNIRDFLFGNKYGMTFEQKMELLKLRNEFNKIDKKVNQNLKEGKPINV